MRTKGASSPTTSVGPAPCDGCELSVRCEARQLACNAYLFYIDGNSMERWKWHKLRDHTERVPSRTLFVKAFGKSAA